MPELNERTNKLYIKHAVGSRMLLDVSGTQKPFELAECPRGWSFVIEQVDAETVQQLRGCARDLNIFYFVEQPGQPVHKRWFYDKDIPQLHHNAETGCLTIEIDSMMEYNNEKV